MMMWRRPSPITGLITGIIVAWGDGGRLEPTTGIIGRDKSQAQCPRDHAPANGAERGD